MHAGVPLVIVGVTAARADDHPAAAACDLVLDVGDGSIDAVIDTVRSRPIASVALVQVLRAAPAARSTTAAGRISGVLQLQAGPEFARWRASRPRRERRDEGEPIRLERRDKRLDITFGRPHVRNALDAAMRDALVDAFRLVNLDQTIDEVHLRGDGPAFCAGGDLDEFGTFVDPATAHLVRLVQSVGRSIADVSGRVTAHLHGACVGSGIELPAFAGTIVAAEDTVIGLPEISLGLIPGAGGTVSLARRIGRHRTARLALTGERIDAATALAWGLVDRIERRDR